MWVPAEKHDRSAHLHASEWAAAMGLSHWATPLDIYARKRGLVPEPEQSPAMWLGQQLEPIVSRMTRRAGLEFDEARGVCVSDAEPWIAGTPDGIPVEFKTARSPQDWGEPPDGQVPVEYEVQCRIYMALLNEPEWYLSVWFRLQDDVSIYRLTRDMEKEAELIERGRRFWVNHVLAEEPPPPSVADSAEAREAVRPPSDGRILRAGGREEEIIWQYREAWEGLHEAQAAERIARDAVIGLIGAADGIEGPWGRITYRADKRGRRVFRVAWAAHSAEKDAEP